LLLAVLLALPGIAVIVFANGWALALGIVLVVLAGAPAILGLGLLLSSLVARWSARHRPFA
jgi:hypothetical protein